MPRGDITLSDSTDRLTPSALEGFFVGWPAPPSASRRLEILRASTYVSIAWAGHDEVAGFVAAAAMARSRRTSRSWRSGSTSKDAASAPR